jgi:predicted ATPase
MADVLLSAGTIEGMIGSPQMQRHAEELLALSTDRGLPLHLGWANVYRGASLATLGQSEECISMISQGMAKVRATGAVTGIPTLLMILAEAHARLGRPADGLNCLAEAAAIIEATDERSNEAELHRLRGDLLDAARDQSAAEHSYQQALGVAKQQSARLFELRASIGLARLWCKQDKNRKARDLLAPICGWFTEGFDAPDLKAARALLYGLN